MAQSDADRRAAERTLNQVDKILATEAAENPAVQEHYENLEGKK